MVASGEASPALRNPEHPSMTMLQVSASMIELRCGTVGGESQRVGLLAQRLALGLGMKEQDAQDLYLAGLLHGIGKLSLPDDILHKSIDRMSHEDLLLYHRHPLRAQMLLTPMAELDRVAHIILHQYERFNGRGTPDGLAETHIPFGSRVLAVARDYEGLQSGVLLRERLLPEQAADLIEMQAGLRYDPQIVDCLRVLLQEAEADDDSASFRQIDSSELVPGMRVAHDLRTSRGVLLLTKGSVVSAHQASMVQRYQTQEHAPFTLLVETAHSEPVAA